MEEGPEPHEFIKESVEHHHHAEEEGHADQLKRETIISACTAAVLAVCAAIGSLLSGHAANEAILHQAKAVDQWSLYQAKSTKGHIYQVGKDIVRVLSEAQSAGANAQRVQQQFDEQVKKYKEDKADPEQEARHLDEESARQFNKHHYYALGVAAFQVGIVMASISIMVRYRPVWYLSLAGGAAGAILLVAGLLK